MLPQAMVPEIRGMIDTWKRRLTDISREGLLGIVLIIAAFLSVFYAFTHPEQPDDSAIPLQDRRLFPALPVADGLQLQQLADNWKYYRIMTSVCHGIGEEDASAAYAWLFYRFDRHAQNGSWTHEQFARATGTADSYYDIAPVDDCRTGAPNLHGLDIHEDYRLRAHAENYVFYDRKVPLCKQVGNLVQARTYTHLAESELEKLRQGNWPDMDVNAAIASARDAPDPPRINGCRTF